MQTEIIKVNGMTCMGCVNSADVSLEQKQVTVAYDAMTTHADQLKKAIKEAGFEVIS